MIYAGNGDGKGREEERKKRNYARYPTLPKPVLIESG